ncbi:MAG: ParA family protein [Chloroflexi bacterium CFX4]|nr:ParA family protein [Chloroflexi bacterium CFX4]
MSVPVIAFFNNKGGVGKTSLVYHLAWMYADQGKRVLAADLDPQANLSSAFLDEDRLTTLLWTEGTAHEFTLYGAINPLLAGEGDITTPHVEAVDEKIGLLVGDLNLSDFEDELADSWLNTLSANKPRAFRVMSAFWRVMQKGAEDFEAAFILVDLGPNLGSINRAALIASDYVVVPLAPDLFSLQGLRNLGPRLRSWRAEWAQRTVRNPDPAILLPAGKIEPLGYVVMQPVMRLDRPIRAYEYWINRIPQDYAHYVLGQVEAIAPVREDNHQLGIIKHYQSLVPMAQEARKPMFKLKPGDGALGSHMHAVQSAYRDFKTLADQIYARLQLSPEVST